MSRRLLAVLAVLIVAAGVAAPGAFASTSTFQTAEYPSVPQQLSPTDDTTVQPAPAQTNAGLAAQTDSLHTKVRYRELLLQERLAEAENDSVRLQLLNEEASDIQAAITDLREREESAYTAYQEGDLSEREFAWQLGQTADEAAALEQWLTTFIDTVDETQGVEFVELGVTRNELRGLQIDVIVSQTPLRDRLYRSMTGDTEAVTRADDFRIGTTETQVTLTAIDGDRYVTESYQPTARDDPQLVSLDFAEIENRTANIYPGFDGFNGIFVPPELGEAVWELQLTESSFDSVLYYDENSDRVFYERQEINLQTVSTEAITTHTESNLTVQVNHTRPGGPAEVRVRDADTGDPVEATITIDGTERGSTRDGSLWVIAPPTQTSLTVVADDRRSEVVVDWTEFVDSPR